MGVAVADFDNDWMPDIFVTGYGGNALYRNRGNCTFEDVTDKAGVREALHDRRRGGRTTIKTARRYFRRAVRHVDSPTSLHSAPANFVRGLVVQCVPWGIMGETDLLYHNRATEHSRSLAESRRARLERLLRSRGSFGVTTTMTAGPTYYVANDTGPIILHNNQNRHVYRRRHQEAARP